MPDYTYDFSDFPNNTVDSTKLQDQILDATAIATAVSFINVRYGNEEVKIEFPTSLSGGEITALDGVVATHDGIPYASSGSNWIESSGESATTSTSYIVKVTLSLDNIEGGNYRIAWNFEQSNTDSNAYYGFRVQLNNSINLMETVVAQSKKYSDGCWYPISGFKYVTLNSGDNFIDIDYLNTHGGQTTYIRNARIECLAVE